MLLGALLGLRQEVPARSLGKDASPYQDFSRRVCDFACACALELQCSAKERLALGQVELWQQTVFFWLLRDASLIEAGQAHHCDGW